MKRLSKLAAILAALVLTCAFFGCSNGIHLMMTINQ